MLVGLPKSLAPNRRDDQGERFFDATSARSDVSGASADLLEHRAGQPCVMMSGKRLFVRDQKWMK